ncbi:hypothetical protein EVAR_45096_1 [Eumeta japonica]|uniref:Uncharacterized protein n=1 Tax=Eumeta variegata TaxID=151549 RepID=A0A4C1YK43_EUMVA|nr:hypothetical protein EVAR_45096_1 [Eumeta japonica]
MLRHTHRRASRIFRESHVNTHASANRLERSACVRVRLTFSIADRVAMPEIHADEIRVNAARRPTNGRNLFNAVSAPSRLMIKQNCGSDAKINLRV